MKENSISNKKVLGVGSFSLPIVLLGIAVSFTQIYGKGLLSLLHIRIPAPIISIILFLIAFILGKKYSKDLFCKSSRVLSIVFTIIVIILSALSDQLI